MWYDNAYGSSHQGEEKMTVEDRVLTLTEEVAALICIHENGIGTRELVEAQEGSDHQGEWQSALKTADAILEYLRTKEATEATIRRVIDKAFAELREEQK
jgi:hypothetical protein